MKDKKIVPGKRIGVFKLGMGYDKVISLLNEDYEKEQRIGIYIIWTEEMGFFFKNDTNLLKQITVRNGFNGLFRERFGLGSSLKEIQDSLGEIYITSDDVYELTDIPGIGFNLGDDEREPEWHDDAESEWYDWEAPIEWISIYKP